MEVMSLTRKEWEEMWIRTERLENYIRELPPHIGCKSYATKYIRFIKDKIQQVIGQME
jgi:hypothetical protein